MSEKILALTGLFCVMLVGNIYMRAKMDGLYFPDPENCGAYFEDVDGVAYRHCCPVGLLFCEELQTCVLPGTPGCSFDCVDSGSPCEPGGNDIIIECQCTGWGETGRCVTGNNSAVNRRICAQSPPGGNVKCAEYDGSCR